jgi:prepilin-type N-terminal cleavage/methylation domain-containing protein
MNSRSQRGFTIIEVMIAMVLLTVGVMALASGSAQVSRMIGRGRTDTMVAEVVTSRADQLRRIAASTTPPCTALAAGNAVTSGITEQWTVLGAAGAVSRDVQLILSYQTARRARTDTTLITLYCD